jgi:hypothetical protein
MKVFRVMLWSVIGLGVGVLNAGAAGQASKVGDSCWKWTSAGKHGEDETASCTSKDGTEQLEIVFSKHEFSYMVIRVSPPLPIKDPQKGWLRQVGQNKVPLTIVFGDEAPISETWGAAQQSDNPMPLLCPMNLSSKPFGKALRTNKMVVSYADGSGKTVNAAFDLTDMREQIKEHHEKTGSFGLTDVLKGVATF